VSGVLPPEVFFCLFVEDWDRYWAERKRLVDDRVATLIKWREQHCDAAKHREPEEDQRDGHVAVQDADDRHDEGEFDSRDEPPLKMNCFAPMNPCCLNYECNAGPLEIGSCYDLRSAKLVPGALVVH
jgi:hypothetical protein